MVAYLIGRSPDTKQPRIVVGDQTVSRSHCMISSLGDDLFELQDNNSTSGTFIRVKGGWRRVTTVHVQLSDEIRLGDYVTTVADLLRRAEEGPDRKASKLERDPETGEIIGNE